MADYSNLTFKTGNRISLCSDTPLPAEKTSWKNPKENSVPFENQNSNPLFFIDKYPTRSWVENRVPWRNPNSEIKMGIPFSPFFSQTTEVESSTNSGEFVCDCCKHKICNEIPLKGQTSFRGGKGRDICKKCKFLCPDCTREVCILIKASTGNCIDCYYNQKYFIVPKGVYRPA